MSSERGQRAGLARIEVRGIGKRYRLKSGGASAHGSTAPVNAPHVAPAVHDFWALRGVNFEVGPGEVFGVIGRNGSGKSTLLQILAGILPPSEGEAVLRGRLGTMLELGSGFDPEETGRQGVFLKGALLGLPRREIEEQFDRILAFAELGSFIDQPVRTYSSGMLMRLAFAVTTCLDVDILLVDEVLAVGDVFFRQKCHARLRELLERGTSVILVSHAMDEVAQLCQRVLVLGHGQPVFLGPAPEAVQRYFLLRAARPPEPDATAAEAASAAVEQGLTLNEPTPEAAFDLSGRVQVGDGSARCRLVALSDVQGRACRSFAQGDSAVIDCEFEILRPLEVPVSGVLLRDERGAVVHGKTTLQLEAAVPRRVSERSVLRVRQIVQLHLAAGEYSLDVGLSSLSLAAHAQRSAWTQEELAEQITRRCHVAGVGHFAVLRRATGGEGVQLPHHGLVNLPGEAVVVVRAERAQ
ncbi:MAG: ABC transporter ATP-binding protein [Planctomycetota bacterium]